MTIGVDRSASQPLSGSAAAPRRGENQPCSTTTPTTPFGFWNDEPTRQLKRTHVGTRSHGEHCGHSHGPASVRTERARRTRCTRPPQSAADPHRPDGRRHAAARARSPSACASDKPQVRAADIQGVDTILVGKLPPPAPTAGDDRASHRCPDHHCRSTTAVATTPAPTEAVVVTPAPTEPPATHRQ